MERRRLEYHTFAGGDRNNVEGTTYATSQTMSGRTCSWLNTKPAVVQKSECCFHFECDRLSHSIKLRGTLWKLKTKVQRKVLTFASGQKHERHMKVKYFRRKECSCCSKVREFKTSFRGQSWWGEQTWREMCAIQHVPALSIITF